MCPLWAKKNVTERAYQTRRGTVNAREPGWRQVRTLLKPALSVLDYRERHCRSATLDGTCADRLVGGPDDYFPYSDFGTEP
jgi:hypothetical protein